MTRQTHPSPNPTATHAIRRAESWLHREQARRQLTGELGRLEGVTEAGGGIFHYRYNDQGDLTQISEVHGQQRHYTYDDQRRLTHVQHPDGGVTQYRYNDLDRLALIDDRGLLTQYTYDTQKQLTQIQHGAAGVSVYRYDDQGRVVLARTSQVITGWRYDREGRITGLEQAIGGVTLQVDLLYDTAGRLAQMRLPGSATPIQYSWDERGRPQQVQVGEQVIADFIYQDAAKYTQVQLGNGVTVETVANTVDGRLARQQVRRADTPLWERRLTYNDVGEIINDGEHRYSYDDLGRLASVASVHPGSIATSKREMCSSHPQMRTLPRQTVSASEDAEYTRQSRQSKIVTFRYDAPDNRIAETTGTAQRSYQYDQANRLIARQDETGATTTFTYDRWGRLITKADPAQVWTYRYDDAGQLLEVRCNSVTQATFVYDHKGRLVLSNQAGCVERYLYGPADELLAVTDGNGVPVRLLVRTPLGVLAEVQGSLADGAVYYHHADERGTLRLLTDSQGTVAARFAYDVYGLPENVTLNNPGICGDSRIVECSPLFSAHYSGRTWYPTLGLYYFGARWYDPALGRFLTPDSYTGAPDDRRLLNPLRPSSQQAAVRSQILGEWLKQPRVRNPYVFCANDPIGRVDPNGHWSFGGVLLTLLGVIWTLPNTLFGLLIEITCLVGEVIRWLVWLVSGGNVSWQTPGFDAAASGNLNAFALVFSGGWLGSFSSLLGITFGNVFFVYKEWRTSALITGMPESIQPPAYGGTVTIPREQMLYEHELRHTNQYGWFGPFFHLGLPLFGVYEWDVIINGYQNAWIERDAREHAEPAEGG